MLSLDYSSALAKAISPAIGIPDQEMTGLKTSMRRYIQEFLKERQLGEHPWSMDPYDKKVIEQVKDVAASAKAKKLQTVVWIGIGGSGLGPKVIQEMFEAPDTIEFILLDSIDPEMLAINLKLIDWRTTLLVVASKSGGTLEPMSLFFLCWKLMQDAMGEKAHERTVAVTDPQKGILHDYATQHGITMLPIPTAVGGRYSIFTPIGLLPLALLGADVDAFIRGAKEIDTVCQSEHLDGNPAAQLAGVQFLLDTKRDFPVRVIMPYAQKLESLARWNQQLIAESLGKVETANPIPLAAIGTQDQHSLLQQWMEGPRKQWHLFIRVENYTKITVPDDVESHFTYIAGKPFGELLDACYQGTSKALTDAKRPNVTITLPELDEYHLGQLFFLLLIETILLGKLYRIDPYGQPGVEAGKVITKELLGG